MNMKRPPFETIPLLPVPTCKALERWFDTLEASLDRLPVAAETFTVCGLLAKGCRDAGALSEEEVK